jgi:hypothetical protein
MSLPDFGLEPDELALLRLTAEKVYNTANGRAFIDELLEDLWLYDEPQDDTSMILHKFAIRLMQKYFGKMLPGPKHRSEITEQIMTVATPTVAEEIE